MSTFLFDKIIFGPVWSRRLGESLGINLLPVNRKVCNFNCVYCECGLTPQGVSHENFPSRIDVISLLRSKLQQMKEDGEYLDSITFAGNGEPTLHPEFKQILKDAVMLRNEIFPKAKVTVLSNATLIGNKDISGALMDADLNILKLDSALEKTMKLINCPGSSFKLDEIIQHMKLFDGRLIIQTLFFRGNYHGNVIDNTTEEEINAWLAVLGEIRPESVMIYSLARDTAVNSLESICADELQNIAARVEQIGIKTQVTP
jgi:wyosine [tRNA(Phe)-imidazoG37] synthetase (radical SAM superfamily)